MKSKVSNILCGSRLQHHSPLLNSCRRGWLQNRLGNRGCVESDAVGKPPEFTRNDGGDITITPHVSVIESKSLTWTRVCSTSSSRRRPEPLESSALLALRAQQTFVEGRGALFSRERPTFSPASPGVGVPEFDADRTWRKEDNHLEDQTINHQFIHKPFP